MAWWPPDSGGGGVAAIEIGSPVLGGPLNAILFVNSLGELGGVPRFAYDGETVSQSFVGPSDGRPLYLATPTEAGTPLWFQRLGGALFGGVFNPVIQIGWNLDAAGLPLNPAFGTVALSFEGNYNNVGVHQQEVHIVFGRANGTEQIRAWSSFMRQSTGHNETECLADQFRISDSENGRALVATTGSEGATPDDATVRVNCTLNITPQQAIANSCLVQWNAAGGVHQKQLVLGAGMEHVTFGFPDRYYSNTGGPASQVFRTGVTMGGTGDKAVGVSNLTLAADLGQTAPLLDCSSAGAIANIKLKKSAIVPVGALAQFKVQDETGAVFYLLGQAA